MHWQTQFRQIIVMPLIYCNMSYFSLGVIGKSTSFVLSNTEISVCKFVDLLIVVELLIVVNMCDTASST